MRGKDQRRRGAHYRLDIRKSTLLGEVLMSALVRFEEFAARLIEGSFAALMGGSLQPVEIAKRLGKVMEDHRVVGAGKVFVPNLYQVLLSPADFQAFAPFQNALEKELATYLTDLAEERGYAFVDRPRVNLRSDGAVRRRRLRVEAHVVDIEAIAPTGVAQMTQEMALSTVPQSPVTEEGFVLVFQGRQFLLGENTVTLGRSLDNDIVVEDAEVSRHQAQIMRRFGKYLLRDLGSSNGTWVNGQLVAQCVLRDGDVIGLGSAEMVFEKVRPQPLSDGTSPTRDLQGDSPSR